MKVSSEAQKRAGISPALLLVIRQSQKRLSFEQMTLVLPTISHLLGY
jgi:hypothetical protein